MNNRGPIKKLVSIVLVLAVVIAFIPGLTIPAIAAPMPVISYYTFQPDGTPYHYYSFGDELFYHVTYDSIDKCYGFRLERMPKDTVSDGWLRDTMSINGTYQFVNTRYKLDTLDKAIYPSANQDMLLSLTIAGQNGLALFDNESKTITLYMKADANLKSPEMEVVVTSLGYRYFQGPVWWSLTNDASEKEKLAKLYEAGLEGDKFMDKSSWDDFADLFNASMENKADLSKETWLTVCGDTIGGYFQPVFAQYKIICLTSENPMLKQPLLAPRAAEFDKRLLYQANVVFNFTDYTKRPMSFSINGKTPPEKAITYSEFMCVVSSEYLASVASGDTILLTVRFNDGTEDTVKINIVDTTVTAYKQIFSDVGTNTTAWEFIQPLVQKGIIDGGGGRFRPDEAVTRAEFYAMLKNIGVQIETPQSPTANIIAADAEKLLFEALTSKQFEAKYNALNKQHLWLPNVHGDMTADDFLFFDKIWPRMGDYYIVDISDMNRTFTRAQAAEVIYRFVQLMEYADELISYQNPKVAPTSSIILVNEESIVFDAYNIGGNNFFKLRDLAFVLNGTAKQFSVDYNSDMDYSGVSGRITIGLGNPYIVVGGEMASKGTSVQTASLSKIWLRVDSTRVDSTYYSADLILTVYNIGGNNYFKLRDIALALNCSVDWDAEKNTVIIETSKGYLSQ